MSRFTINSARYVCVLPYMKTNGCAEWGKKKNKKWTPICGQNMEFSVLSETGNLLQYSSYREKLDGDSQANIFFLIHLESDEQTLVLSISLVLSQSVKQNKSQSIEEKLFRVKLCVHMFIFVWISSSSSYFHLAPSTTTYSQHNYWR